MAKAVKGIAQVLALILLCLAFSACGRTNVDISDEHVLINPDGDVLIRDDSIDVSDLAAQTKIEAYLSNGDIEIAKPGVANDQMSQDIYAKGNAIVMEFYITAELSEEQKAAVKENLTPKMAAINIEDGRKDTGVSNLVFVYALFDRLNNLIMSDIIK